MRQLYSVCPFNVLKCGQKTYNSIVLKKLCSTSVHCTLYNVQLQPQFVHFSDIGCTCRAGRSLMFWGSTRFRFQGCNNCTLTKVPSLGWVILFDETKKIIKIKEKIDYLYLFAMEPKTSKGPYDMLNNPVGQSFNNFIQVFQIVWPNIIDYIDGKLDVSLLINISAGFEP